MLSRDRLRGAAEAGNHRVERHRAQLRDGLVASDREVMTLFGDASRRMPVAGPAFELAEVEQHGRERSFVAVLDVLGAQRLEHFTGLVEVVGPLEREREGETSARDGRVLRRCRVADLIVQADCAIEEIRIDVVAGETMRHA